MVLMPLVTTSEIVIFNCSASTAISTRVPRDGACYFSMSVMNWRNDGLVRNNTQCPTVFVVGVASWAVVFEWTCVILLLAIVKYGLVHEGRTQ